MTPERKTKLQEQIKEEMADHKRYMDMADELRKEGMEQCAGIACDIAHEELTHATLLEHMIEMGESKW